MKSWSIKGRLMARLLVLLTMLWLVGAGIAIAVLTDESNEVFDDALESVAKMLAAAGSQKEIDGALAQRLKALALSGEQSDYISYQVRGADGSVREHSANASAEAFAAPVAPGFQNAGSTRYYTLATGDGTFVQVAEAPEERQEALAGLLKAFIAPLLALLAASSVVVWRTVKEVTAPIDLVATQIRDRDGGRLDPIQNEEMPDELKPVVADINKMLHRLQRALDAERAFSANCAHELRNPVAAARAQAALIAGSSESDSNQHRGQMLASSLAALGHRIERLLQLSRADAGITLSHQPANLIKVLHVLIRDYELRPALACRIAFDDGGLDDLRVNVDQDALGIAVQNLIDNAIAHGDAGTAIDIVVTSAPSLIVRNRGASVAPSELQALASRYVRGSNRPSNGFGLGLAIVDQIMTQSGGRLSLSSPIPGGADGFQAELQFVSFAESAQERHAAS